MNRTVICVSHATGAGGTELGRVVADKLGFRLVDEEIVTRAAENQNVTVDDLANVERRKSLLNRILRDVAIGAATGPSVFITAYAAEPQPATNSLRALITQSINETADEGNVVIVSHAASYALAGRGNVLRVLVTASPGIRVRRLVDSSKRMVLTRSRRRSRSTRTTQGVPTISNGSMASRRSCRRTMTWCSTLM